ncbi:MAG: YjgP/YjgQ family permease [Flavobacteriales bacterium]|nr:MAG: YjgP/YjgQ family permease [Flavobacteriales bacterium]
MKILDLYIIKKYIGTFFVMLGLFIPIGIMVDIAEKIDKFRENEVPTEKIIDYYTDFIWYFANQLYPVFIFLAVIWFTSRIANNTEITAMLSSGLSYKRFVRPYLISASLIMLFTFFSGMFIVPKSNLRFNEFISTYIKNKDERQTDRLFKQINNNEYVYVSSYDPSRKRGMNFTLEHFDGIKMKHKISSSNIRWLEEDSVFRLMNYRIRTFKDDLETLGKMNYKDTILDFNINDLAPVNYVAETLNYSQLNKLIRYEKSSGSTLINSHLLVRHKRYTLPLSCIVLSIIGVSVSSFKQRGGMGLNLAIGVSLGFFFIFLDKILGVLVVKSNFSPGIAAWGIIFIFSFIAFFLLKKAMK